MMEEEEETLFDQEGLLGDKASERSEKADHRRKVFKTAALSFAFFSLGCCVAIPGATLLDLGERVGKDTEHMTFIAMARSAGYLVGSVFGGIMSDFFDPQLLMFYTLTLTSAATAVIPWCTVLYTMTGMIGVQGIALGVLDTGGNVFCIRIWGKKSPPYMQLLHFAFAVGAFIAPLIAHPFLLNSISEFSSNQSVNGNVSLKAILPYATSEHMVPGRARRDLSLQNTQTMNFKGIDSSLFYSSRHRRDVGTQAASSTDSVSSINKLSNISSIMNISDTQATTLTHQFKPTTARPKKPEVVNPLSKEHADSHLNAVKLKNLKENPVTGDDEGGADKTEEDDSAAVTNIPTVENNSEMGLGNKTNTTVGNDTDNTTSNILSGNETEIELRNPIGSLTSPKSAFTTTTTPTTQPIISSITSTTTTTTTTTITTTTSSTTTPIITTPSTSTQSTSTPRTPPPHLKEQTPAIEQGSVETSTVNASLYHNSTRPETWEDLVYGMLDTMRHMSKIQFAYLIIGFFLIGDAGFFLSLYCKDKVSGYRLLAMSHEDLTRPPHSPCFVATLLIMLFIFFLFYVGMEQTYGILLTTFAVEFPATIWTPAQGATLTAVFWGCVALGRGISICVSRFFKAPCMLVSNLVLTLLGAILLSFVLKASWISLWVGTVLLGLGMSSLFPTTISWTDSYYPLTGKAAAVFVAGSGVGQMTVPVLTGYLYQNVDRMCLMYVVFCLSILLCVIYTVLQVVAIKRASDTGVSRSHSGFMRLHTSEDMADSLDMDLIQAGGMEARPMSVRGEETHRKENGVGTGESTEYEVTEFSKLVELSD